MKSKIDPLKITLRDAAEVAGPICLGYFPISLALGVLAQKAGIPLVGGSDDVIKQVNAKLN